MSNKTKGVLWIVGPIIFLFLWFVLFGMIRVVTNSTGGSTPIMTAIFPIITGLAIIFIPIGIIVGIIKLKKGVTKHGLSKLYYCKQCGDKTAQDSEFCAQCGVKLI